MKNEKRLPSLFKMLIASALSLFLFSPLPSSAAGMSYSVAGPSTATVGQEFQVTVQLNSAVDIDTARLEGSFTPDFLAWRGIVASGPLQNISPGTDTDGTSGNFSFGVFTMEDPANGNTKIAVITLKALKPGTGELRLLSGSAAYANGEGGDIPGGSLKIVISSPKTPVVVPKPVVPYVPATSTAPYPFEISSPTQPDPNQWYSGEKVVINWVTTKPVKEVVGSFDQSPTALSYSPLTDSSATFYATRDGLWYAHILIIYQDGTYSSADFLVRIDRTAPKAPAPVARQTGVPQNVPNSVSFGTTDGLSGIDHYEIWINGKYVTSTRQPSYPLVGLPEGVNTIQITAVDKAGNKSKGSTSFDITQKVTKPQPISPTAAGLRRFFSSWLWMAAFFGLTSVIAAYWVIFFIIKRKKKNK
ncbi:MAG: cohesin domain-containing protein [Patescibacteria group bacterium]